MHAFRILFQAHGDLSNALLPFYVNPPSQPPHLRGISLSLGRQTALNRTATQIAEIRFTDADCEWSWRRNRAEFSFRVSLDGQILSVSAERHVTNDIAVAAAVNEVYSRRQRLLVKNSVNLSHSAFPFPLLLQSHQGDTLMPGARR